MIALVKHRIAQTMQRAAWGGLGGVFLLTGVGFLTAALFLFLLTQTDPITACLVLGGGFAGLGLIVVGVSRVGTTAPQPQQMAETKTQADSAMTPVVLAFLDGLQQGMAARTGAKPRAPQ